MDDGRVNDLSQVVTAIVRINIDDTIMASDQGTELGCLRHALREAAGTITTSSGLTEHVILNHQDVIITKICGKEQECTVFSSTTIRGESADIRTLMPGTSYDMARQFTPLLCVQRRLPLYAMYGCISPPARNAQHMRAREAGALAWAGRYCWRLAGRSFLSRNSFV